MGCRLAQACHALAVEVTAEDICAPAQAESYRQEVSLLGEMLHTLDAAEGDDELLDQLLDALEPLGLAGDVYKRQALVNSPDAGIARIPPAGSDRPAARSASGFRRFRWRPPCGGRPARRQAAYRLSLIHI